MNQVKAIQNQLVAFLEIEKSIVFAYVFGSVAQGKTNLESDVDMAVYLDVEKAGDLLEKDYLSLKKSNLF